MIYDRPPSYLKAKKIEAKKLFFSSEGPNCPLTTLSETQTLFCEVANR